MGLTMVLHGYRQTAATWLLGFAIGLAPCVAMADAIISLTGPTSNAGDINLTTADGNYGGEITIGGTTGYSLWGLLGGAKAANPNSPIYGAITTSTPPGLNGKNAILRYYLLATSTSGARSVISLGEIDPQFSGGPSELVTVTGNTASLVFTNPGAGGRNVGSLASLQLLSAPALSGPGGQSAAVTLKGNVGHPGAYTLSDLESLPALGETVNGHAYTGVRFFDLVDPSNPDILDQYVVTAGTDGYEVVLSLAELDPALGASTAPNEVDLVPCADASIPSDFPGDGVARTILPGDENFAHGRWESNLDLIEVGTVPEPATMPLLVLGLAGFWLVARRRRALSGTIPI
ncbi:MAG TPA: PEP-CTERM sorting domain-containing protein [Stellaceae bacterium]|jgi:hypothetical protein|nr:PEP-CTERM sorting domain-containing protein [Stellaceae bacterium]